MPGRRTRSNPPPGAPIGTGQGVEGPDGGTPLQIRRDGHQRWRLNTMKHIESRISPEPNTGCWLWTGNASANGYGITSLRGRSMCAHRAVYLLHKGHIPEGLELDHLCRQKICVNPDHLEPVTHSENMKRVTPDGDRPCWAGHDLSHWRITPGGKRYCKTCHTERKRRWRAKGNR